MNLLLDTHTLLWFTQGHARLSANAAGLMKNPHNVLHLSLATVWEVAIKSGMGKLNLGASFENYFTAAVRGFPLDIIPITLEDCIAYEALGFPDPAHRDPFDRMIAVQARRHNLAVVSADAALDAYSIVRHW